MSTQFAPKKSGPAPRGAVDRLTKTLLVRSLRELRNGSISLIDGESTETFGTPGDLNAVVHVHRNEFFRHAVLGGTLSIAESYLRGDWDCDDLTSLFRLFVRNSQTSKRLNRGAAILSRWGHSFYHWRHANSVEGSKKNIHAHYDLGNDFFSLWLDDTLAYSSGIFTSPQATLRDASIEKFDRICRNLKLKPADNVLEIGSGWGGFAIHAAQNYGCRVTTTTISQEQFQLANERIVAAGLQDRIEVLLKDYRELEGRFDKLVSIEMIEAVGRQYFDVYFRQCSDLLKPGGSFLLQAIVMPEQRYASYLKSVDFIQRYVFPGGCLPSLGAILESVGKCTDLQLVHYDDYASHYAETLRRWRAGFESKLDEVRKLGKTERFIRLWRYYLCYCEAGFDERAIGLVQM
ncbi:MAG TPA: cyclopropane-fatty-acyl-phospholipid synthase family protein, partial [Pirellulales bacterium]